MQVKILGNKQSRWVRIKHGATANPAPNFMDPSDAEPGPGVLLRAEARAFFIAWVVGVLAFLLLLGLVIACGYPLIGGGA